MCYRVLDTQACSEETCEQLEEAIKLVLFNLNDEEQSGRYIEEEPMGRWAIYDGFLVRMLWIEADDGEPVCFSRANGITHKCITKTREFADRRSLQVVMTR